MSAGQRESGEMEKPHCLKTYEHLKGGRCGSATRHDNLGAVRAGNKIDVKDRHGRRGHVT